MWFLQHTRRGPWLAVVCALILPCLFMIGGCSHGYICDNGKTIDARYQLGGERVVIDVDDGSFTLPKIPSDTGAKYGDKNRTFWFKGDELIVETAGKHPYGRCILPK